MTSTNLYMNFGMFIPILVVYSLISLLLFFLKIFASRFSFSLIMKVYSKVASIIYFNFAIRYMIENYLNFASTVFVSCTDLQFNTNYDKGMALITLAFLLLTLAFPIFSLLFIVKNQAYLAMQTFK